MPASLLFLAFMLLLVLQVASLLLLMLSWYCMRLALSGAPAVFPAVICAPAVAGFPTHFLASLRLLDAPAVVRLLLLMASLF
jgi:hypothetical protein